MCDAAAENRIFQLERELGRWPHTALGSQRAAEHQGSVTQLPVGRMSLDQSARVHHRAHLAVLIEHASAALDYVRTQPQSVPMRRYVVERPKRRCDRLVAHLLRYRHTVFFDFPIGMVGTGAYPELAGMLQQDEFNFPAGGFADHFDRRAGGEPRRCYAIKDRSGGRPLHAERFELANVLLDRGGIASGPAGNHRRVDGDLE